MSLGLAGLGAANGDFGEAPTRVARLRRAQHVEGQHGVTHVLVHEDLKFLQTSLETLRGSDR